MRKSLFLFWFSICAVAATAQFTTKDAALDKRLQAYMQLSKALNFDKLMDYMHPSLFEIAPREAILQSFDRIFNTTGMKVAFDSLQLLGASAPFNNAGVVYRKVDYFMQMHMQFDDTAMQGSTDFQNKLIASFEKSMPGKKVAYDNTKAAFVISGTDVLLAIKDPKIQDWMFLGYQKNQELLSRLYPKEVLAHFKLL